MGAREPVPVDVRILAATHRDLLADVADGLFREDLFHRLAVGQLSIPPLAPRGSRRDRSFVPMAVNSGLGAEVQRPLATVVIGPAHEQPYGC